jgi:Integrase zinc binding domain
VTSTPKLCVTGPVSSQEVPRCHIGLTPPEEYAIYPVSNGKRTLLPAVAGHLGINKAYERLRQGVTWTEMYSELKSYVRSCNSCQRNKTSNQKPIGLLKPLEIPTERFEQVIMDFITTLPVTKENHDAVMVIVDELTKLVMLIPNRYGYSGYCEEVLQSLV